MLRLADPRPLWLGVQAGREAAGGPPQRQACEEGLVLLA